MVNYSRVKKVKFLNGSNNPLSVKKREFNITFLFFLIFLPAVLYCPVHAYGMDQKVVVLPFKIESTEPAGALATSLQEMISKDMKEMGYDIISTGVINSTLGDNISYSAPEKKIIPLAKANNADWIIIGEFTEKDGSIQLDVNVMDPDSAKTPFSVMMIANDRNNLNEAIKKIAESLNDQISKNVVIADIKVNGSKRASEDAVLNIIESKKGDQFDQEKLDRDLRTIYKMGFFEDMNYDIADSPDGKIITFNLIEKPTIINITFEGNHAKKEDKLMEELGIKKYSVLNRNEVRQSTNRLLEYYRNDGYYNVNIKPQIKTLADENEVILNYVIDEGEKVYIKKIEFRGNEVFDSDDLKDIMLTKEKDWLTWFTDSGVLDKKKLEFDMQRLRAYYDNDGYIKAQIGEPEVTYDEKEEGLTVTINIVEGHQHLINKIIIDGDLLRPAAQLRNMLNIKDGDPFSRQVIYTEKDNITNLYADLGYAYAEATPSSKDIEGTNLVDVTLYIQKNKRVRIERINIYGNEITKDKVFRRELKIIEGEYFSRQKLDKSKENLDRLELFESSEIKTRKGSSDDLMMIDIEGKEQLRRSISFSAGYGGYEGFMVQMQYSNNNLYGRGQNFSLNALLGGTTTQFNASLTEPWLFDKPVRGTVTGYKWDMDYDEYTRERTGGGGGLAFLVGLDEYTRATVQYSYDKSNVTNISYYASPSIWAMAGVNTTSSLAVGIERNSKDKWWDTTRGSLNYFTIEYAGGFLGGDSAFNKYQAGSTFYLPIIGRTVLVVGTELGYVTGRAGGYLPIYEKFQLGGIDSVRGYEWGVISPLDPRTYSEIGGNFKWLYKLEYRFPLVKDQGMTGLVFFDAGNAFNRDTSWKKGAGKSVGFGLRWLSPMGPLRLEYGYKLADNPRDTDPGRFEFKISGAY